MAIKKKHNNVERRLSDIEATLRHDVAARLIETETNFRIHRRLIDELIAKLDKLNNREASKSSVSKAFNLKKAMDVDQGSVYYEIDATLGPARIIDTNFYTPKIKTPRIVVKYYTENNGHYLVVVNQDGTYEGKQVLFNI